MYKIIDENLKIASCGIGDLDSRMVSGFLAQWEDGAKIDSLTMFFERDKDYLVLNSDNNNYDFYLKLTKEYLMASDDMADEIRRKAPVCYEETMEILDSFRKYRAVAGEMKIIGHHGLVYRDTFRGNVLQAIMERSSAPVFQISMAYRYGVICGKREERARRKKRSSAPAESTHCMSILTDEDIRGIVKGEADRLDIQTTFDYFTDLVEADFEEAEVFSPLEKMMWIVRHAHLIGFEKALRNYNKAIKEVLKI